MIKKKNGIHIAENLKFLFFHAAECFEEDADDIRSYALKWEVLPKSLHYVEQIIYKKAH
jgi:hypothetical protein